jgi:hypothetical protein
VVAGAAFLTLLVGSGLRSVPTVMITPLCDEFGWRVDQILPAIEVNLVLFGLMAPRGRADAGQPVRRHPPGGSSCGFGRAPSLLIKP